MSHKQNRTSGVYQYLEQSGVLESGTAEEIAAVHKEYWRLYKRIWKRNKRYNEHEFKVYYTEDEYKAIVQAARLQRTSKTRYIKESSLSFANGNLSLPNHAQLALIIELLDLNYGLLEELCETIPEDIGLM